MTKPTENTAALAERRSVGVIPHTVDDLARLSAMISSSHMSKDVRNAAQAAYLIQAGAELGLPPIASVQQLVMVKGKVTMSAQAWAALIKRSGKYNYTVQKHTEKGCRLQFFERWGDEWKAVGESTFTIDDAKRAGLLKNNIWHQYPKAMLFARALTAGARIYCPDVSMAAYTSEELGGEVIDASVVYEPARAEPAPESVKEAPKAEPVEAEVIEAETEEVDSAREHAEDVEVAGWNDAVEVAGWSDAAEYGDALAVIFDALDRLGVPKGQDWNAAQAAAGREKYSDAPLTRAEWAKAKVDLEGRQK